MANSPVRSIRAPEDFWAQIDAYAEAQRMKPGPALIHAARVGMSNTIPPQRPDPPATPTKPDPKTVLRNAETAAAHLAAPRKPSAKQLAWRKATSSVPFGPTPTKPGSRLIDKHKSKKR